MRQTNSTCLFFSLVVALPGFLCADDEFHPRQKPLPVKPPQNGIVLLGPGVNRFLSKHGKKIDWKNKDDVLISTKGNARSNHIVSQVRFRDADIHVEFKLPEKGSGNSGVYIHGNYEVQIINSHGKQKIGQGDCGALYGFDKPLVNACLQPGEWQVLDIRFQAPRRNAKSEIVQKGKITAWLNGKKVLDGTEFGEPKSSYHPYRYRSTDFLKGIWEQQKKTMVGPVFLQDHDNPVEFRNVWLVPLDDKLEMHEAKK